MIKKLNFVFDRKSGDAIAPQFVPSHVWAIRNYITLTDSDKENILSKFPSDFELVTVDFDSENCCLVRDTGDSTSFLDIVRKDNGDVNGSSEN